MSEKNLKGAFVFSLRDISTPANLEKKSKVTICEIGAFNNPNTKAEIMRKPRTFKVVLHVQYSIDYLLRFWKENPEYDGVMVSYDTVISSDSKLNIGKDMTSFLYQELTKEIKLEDWQNDIDMTQSFVIVSYAMDNKEVGKLKERVKKRLIKAWKTSKQKKAKLPIKPKPLIASVRNCMIPPITSTQKQQLEQFV